MPKIKKPKEVEHRIKSKRKIKDLEDTAKAVQTIIETGYISHTRIYRVNFIRGIFFGLGSALGATVLFAVLAYVLSLFDQLPIIGGLIDVIQNTVDNR